jgi:hypothetical protein
MYLAAAGLLIAGGVVIRNAKPTTGTFRNQMIQVSHTFVRASLDESLRAAFAGEEETVVEALPDHKFMISGWVDLITQQGTPDRQNFSCVIYKNTNDTWVGERITVIPQM